MFRWQMKQQQLKRFAYFDIFCAVFICYVLYVLLSLKIKSFFHCSVLFFWSTSNCLYTLLSYNLIFVNFQE